MQYSDRNFNISTRYSPGLGCCAPDFGNDTWGSAAALYGAVYAILGLGLPAVLVTVCNLRVLGIARYHRHRIASAIYEVTLSAQVTITHQRNPFFVPTVTAPSAGGPPRFRSAASTVRKPSTYSFEYFRDWNKGSRDDIVSRNAFRSTVFLE